MKILLSILSSLTIAGSGATSLANITHQSVKANSSNTSRNQNVEEKFVTNEVAEIGINNNEELFDYDYSIQSQNEEQFNISQFLEQYLTEHPDSELEDDLLNSLFIVNQSIQINFDLLANYKNDIELYQVLTSNGFIASLNEMYHKGLLTYDADYQVFSFGTGGVQAESNKNKHIWVQWHWYWFGYYRIHIDHQWSQKIASALSKGAAVSGVLAGVVDQEPLSKTALAALTVTCLVASWIFSGCDHGKGAWVAFYVITLAGWGSNK